MSSLQSVPVSTARELKQFFAWAARYFAFWLLFFLLCRVVFLCYHLDQARELDPFTVLRIFGYGVYVDASAAGYLTALPVILRFAQQLGVRARLSAVIDGYSFLMVCILSVLATADLQVYREWGVKLNALALSYLKFPREAAASMGSSPLGLLLAICAGLVILGSLAYLKIASRRPPERTGAGAAAYLCRSGAFLLAGGLVFLCIRGSVGQAPMNPSFAYFSPHQFANLAALNTGWNLLYDVKYYLRNTRSQYRYLADAEVEQRMARITHAGKPNQTEYVLKNSRPNIVCIILESWTADVVKSLGGVPGLTPNLEQMIGEGLLFTDIYSSGSRTSYGIPSVLSGFPSTPDGSVLDVPRKMERLPVLARELQPLGYHSTFYYGGDAHFDNMYAYFMHGGFQRVVDRSSFDKKDFDSKWGAHDGPLFQRVLADLKGAPQPFLVSLLTLSSHEPYEVPMARAIPGTDETSLFKNAMVYADRSLGEFFREAKRQPWYQNTLFVLVADHGHRLPLARQPYQAEKFHIPVLLVGGALREEYRGVRRGGVGAQSDLAATILEQMRLKHDAYLWSNNLLNRHRNNYAFFNLKDGFGWRTDDGAVSFDDVSKRVLLDTSKGSEKQKEERLKDAQAYMQFLAGKYGKF